MDKFLDFVSIPPHIWSMVAVWINTLILFLLVKKFLFKPIQNILAQRDAEIKEMYDSADKAETSAKAMEAEYEQKLADAKNEAGRIMQRATKAASEKGEEIVAEAQSKASDIISKAQVSIEQERKAAVSEIQGQVADMAVLIAQKVIEKEIDPKTHKRLVEEFINSGVECK